MIHSIAGDSQIVAFISSGVIFCSELTICRLHALQLPSEFDVDE